MQSRGTAGRRIGRSRAWVDEAVTRFSPEVSDERQAAVLGQVSSAALAMVIWLNYAAGVAFMLIGYHRFAPCVWAFYAIGLGAQTFTSVATRRQRVNLPATVKVPTWTGIVSSSIIFGTLFFAIERIAGTGYGGGWTGNLVEAAVAMLVWALLLTRNRNRKRKAALYAENTADEPLDA
jgi:hypothetical protein